MTQDEIISLIEDHGGEVVDDPDDNVTCMVAPLSEIEKKENKKS